MELLDAWTELLTDIGKLADALEAGTPSVIHVLGDALDDYIASVVPAYSAVRSACDAVSSDCTATREQVRDEALTELLRTAGVYSMITAVVDAWHVVPKAIRDVARKAGRTISDLSDLISDPSIDHLVALCSDVGGVLESGVDAALGYVASAAEFVGDEAIEGASWLISRTPRAIVNVIETLPATTGVPQALASLGRGDPLAAVEDLAAAPFNGLIAIGSAVYDAFGGSSDDSVPYEYQWEWNTPLYGIPAGLAGLFARKPYFAAALHDPVVNFGLRAESGLAPSSTCSLDVAQADDSHTCPAVWCILDDRPVIGPEQGGGIGELTRILAIRMISAGYVSPHTDIRNALLDHVMRTPRGNSIWDDRGLLWLTGPAGVKVLSAMFGNIDSRRGMIHASNMYRKEHQGTLGFRHDMHVRMVPSRDHTTWLLDNSITVVSR